MSRIISFRVWDKYEKKYLLPEKQGFVILPTRPSFGVTIPYQSKYYMDENIDIDCVDWADADLIMGRYELEQDTGLKDKNGEKIYENDIVKTTRSYGYGFLPKGAKAKVVFDEKELCYKLQNQGEFRLTSKKEVEIIGNVNENPELIA